MSDFRALLEKDCCVKIHQRNIQTLALEIFKAKNYLNPNFMKNIICSLGHEIKILIIQIRRLYPMC